MTPAELLILKKEIVATSAYYQIKLDPQVIGMYAEDLSDLPLDLVLAGYRQWRKGANNFRFPLPAQIRATFETTLTDDDRARDASSRIVSALSKFGYIGAFQAKEYIGELGWRIVERQGGWQSLCERTMSDELPIYQAQWAKLALSILHFHETGHSDAPSKIESSHPIFSLISALSERKKLESANQIDDGPKGAA